ncbi:HAD family hydrolase [Oceanisphaera pacifica]|uniref:HAD family hydrolase n=1 Tax=Oceanisphaera pacifica TaxID=2818389 RepID=A0ABS3NHY6_9GAMM|nr:HAD family hydrolase [Oceanisphaera pacifica]MBO1520204.1 HAD family hydrolase [Oceanisphaera pacifica]
MKLAIFDLDETLIAGDSASLWLAFMVRRQLASADILVQEKNLMDAYYQGQMDMNAYMALTLAPLNGWQTQDLAPLVEEFLQQDILPIVYSKARKRLNWHQAQGHCVVIVSATGEHLVNPIARALGVEHAIGIMLECCDGVYNGRTHGVYSYQEGKLIRLQSWLDEQGLIPSLSYAYSDSLNDLPLLQYADQAAVVNGDAHLRLIAQQRGWEQLSW